MKQSCIKIKTDCGHSYGIEEHVWEHVKDCKCEQCEHCCWKICGICGKRTNYTKVGKM